MSADRREIATPEFRDPAALAAEAQRVYDICAGCRRCYNLCPSFTQLLDTIDEREANILKLRYGLNGEDPLTLKEIGQRIGLTRERVRQLEHQSLRKLRDAMNGDDVGSIGGE